jgi:polo-like kinase 1
MEANT